MGYPKTELVEDGDGRTWILVGGDRLESAAKEAESALGRLVETLDQTEATGYSDPHATPEASVVEGRGG